MGDFFQTGTVTTIHRLGGHSLSDLSSRLKAFSQAHPLAILIPALASEMDAPALEEILGKLIAAEYLDEVIIALGRADRDDFRRMGRLLEPLPMRTTVVWPEGPEISSVLDSLRPGLDVGSPGKGRDVWIALGYLLSAGRISFVAMHDADIVNFTGEIPVRLLLPLADPSLNFSFCKGYYPRISNNALHGRVTRLLVSPLVSVLMETNPDDALSLVASMRYPLAGEFSMAADLAGRIGIPRDWGLEVGILSAVSAATPSSRICQAGLCENYEHKHQMLSADDQGGGLNRMSVEVSETLLRGSLPNGGWGRDLVHRYRQRVDLFIPMYRADALANGLDYDEDSERLAVETFAKAVESGLERLEFSRKLPPLPPWRELERSRPGTMEAIAEAVKREGRD